ncbi:hypothetical protein [Flavobacterium psychrotrophum]|uniref:hypothetical protein n=1 Tax=Flavobacterium psychrotrophum TaxID=2294119 RepID=UPI0013C4F9F0|nr:hypothetical protein [Flavobacterium psychrotrophum]
MKRILLLLILLPVTGFAQHFEWLKTPESLMPYNPDLVGYTTTTDGDGNIFYTGFKDTPYIYNSIMGSLYFNKYSTNGTLLFSKTIGGQAQSYNMLTDSQGNTYMALGYVGSITIENITISTINQGEVYLLAKFGPMGNLIWHKELVPTDMGDNWYNEIAEFKALALDTRDNLYIGYADFFKSYVEKIVPQDGTVAHTLTQDNVRRISSVAVDSDDNVYTAGSCIETDANFNGTNVTTTLNYNVYVAKYSGAGENRWVKIVEDITCSEPRVAVKSPDSVYFSSNLSGAFAFDNLVAEEGVGSEQFFLTKLNAQGQYQWLRQTPPNSRFALGNRNNLSLDNAGNVYLGGNTSGTIHWGNGITTSILSYSLRGIVVKYDSQGMIQMAKIVGGNNNEVSITRFDDITLSNSGDIITAGMGFGPTAFDAITYDPQQDTSYYPFLTKLSKTTAGTDDFSKKTISIYPSPAKDKIYITGITATLNAGIFNLLGQKVKDISATPTQPIDITALPPAPILFIQKM